MSEIIETSVRIEQGKLETIRDESANIVVRMVNGGSEVILTDRSR